MTTINQLDGKRVIIPILLQITDFCMQPAKVYTIENDQHS